MRNKLPQCPSESEEQKALVKWWSFQFPQYDNLLFHIPNGGLRNIKTAARLKSEGVKPGVADMFLAMPNGQYHGMFIEMKRIRGNGQTELQRMFQNAVESQGYRYLLAKGWMQAKTGIMEYIKGNL